MKTSILIKRAIWVFSLISLPLIAKAQNLIVGYFDHNQVMSIRNTTLQYDSVLVMNNGTLNIDSSNFTVNNRLAILGTGTLNVGNSNFIVNGISIFIKRYVHSLANNIKKVFWRCIKESASYSIEFEHNDYFDNTGLVYNGCSVISGNFIYNTNGVGEDLGDGVEKLSYFTYKIMTEKLEGSDWDSITTVIDSVDNKYVYKFINDSTGNPTYVAWWDYFNDSTYNQGDSNLITLSGISANHVIVTNAVPTDTSGINITDYNTAFQIDTLSVTSGSVSFYLKESPVFVEEISNTTIDETGSITPNEFQLNQNYPNPFNPTTTISFQLPRASNVELKIYNLTGQLEETLVNEKKDAGYYSIRWNASQYSSGVYIYRIQVEDPANDGADGFSAVKKCILMK